MPLLPLRLSGLAVCFVFFTAAGHAQAPVLQPGSVEVPVQPGTQARQVLTLTNPGETERALTIGLAGWTLGREGTLRLSPPDTSETAPESWVRFTPAYVTLPPGERRRIIVDVAVPQDLPRAGDYRFAVIASAIEPDARTGRMEKTELSSLFYLTASPAISAPVVTDARIQTRQERPPALELDLSNSGNAHARLEGEIIIEGEPDARIALPVSNLVVLEGQQRRFSIPVDQEIPAEARVTVRLDNIFAPQDSGGVAPMREYSAPLHR